MKIIVDPPKRVANLQHGFDQNDFATHFEFATAKAVSTVPSSTGRVRYVLIGRWSDGRLVSAVVSPLGEEALALISLRTASRKERRAYDQA